VSEDRLHQKAHGCSQRNSRWWAVGDERSQPGHQVVDGAGRGRVAAVAAVVLYEHASALVRAHGEFDWTGHLIPLTVDGLICASWMVMLDSARRGIGVPVLAR
jgi:hypothetical protein